MIRQTFAVPGPPIPADPGGLVKIKRVAGALTRPVRFVAREVATVAAFVVAEDMLDGD